MKRPPIPTGEGPELNRTVRLNPVTHPTEVFRRAELRLAERHPQRLLDGLLKGALILIPTGGFIGVLAALNGRVGWLAFGFTVAAAGCCLATLESLLDPERPELDQRVWRLLVSAVDRVRKKS